MWLVGSEALKAKMQALGMRPKARTDGTLEGILPFRNLVNAFTQSAILAATVRNYGEDAIVCIAPAHLAHLPAIRILDCPNAATLEYQVQQLYQRRLEKLREVNQFLSKLGLNAELDEPGFRVVSETWVGDDVVRFTVRPGQVVQVIAISGRSLEVAIDAKERRIDARKARSTRELEAILEPLIAKLKAPRQAAPRPVVVPVLPIDKPSAPEPVRSLPASQMEPLELDAGPAAAFTETEEDEFSLSLRKSAAPSGTPASPTPGSMRPGADMFDHSFAGFAEEDEFSGLTPMKTPISKSPSLDLADDDSTVPTVASSPEAQLLALVCGECGRFYLVEENPADVRLLDTCPRCIGTK